MLIMSNPIGLKPRLRL